MKRAFAESIRPSAISEGSEVCPVYNVSVIWAAVPPDAISEGFLVVPWGVSKCAAAKLLAHLDGVRGPVLYIGGTADANTVCALLLF